MYNLDRHFSWNWTNQNNQFWRTRCTGTDSAFELNHSSVVFWFWAIVNPSSCISHCPTIMSWLELEPQEIYDESDVVTFALLELLRGPIQSDRLLERWGQGWSFENQKSWCLRSVGSYVLIPFRRAPAMVVSLAVPFQLKRTDLSLSKHSFQFTWHSFRFTWFTGPSLTESTVSVRHSDRQQDLASFAQRRSAVEEAVFRCKPCEKEPRELMFGQITWGRRR